MKDQILKTLLIEAAPEVIWEHLTDPVKIAGWLMPNDFESRVGAGFTMHCEPQGGSNGEVVCEVKELVKPERLVYSWVIDVPAVETLVTIILEPEAGGTRLRLAHSGWSALDDIHQPVADRHEMGWEHLLGTSLRGLVAAGASV